MSEACSRARNELVRQFLDKMDEQRNRVDMREPSSYDVILSEVRRSCIQWNLSATQVAGAMHDFMTENFPDQVAPLKRFQRV